MLMCVATVLELQSPPLSLGGGHEGKKNEMGSLLVMLLSSFV